MATTTERCRRLLTALLVTLLAPVIAGCPAATPPSSSSSAGARPAASTGTLRLSFWHTRRAEQEALLRTICEDYERQNPGVDLQPEYQGNYNDLQKKIRAAIAARSLPALAVGYEPQIAEYMANGVVRPLDDLVADPGIGLKPPELEDIPPQFLAGNRFKEFGGQLLSFPFTKSTLLLYYNESLLAKGGFTGPPETWAEFEKQAAALTRLIRSPALAFDADASTLDGMIYSHGGELLSPDGKTTLLDQPAVVETLALLQRMAKAKTLGEYSGDDLAGVFANQRCAFGFSTSASLAYTVKQVGSAFEWDVAPIPHAAGAQPATVLYGPNVCVFKGRPEHEREAWKFIRYFVSPEVTARWARETGYLPVRSSAAQLSEMQDWLKSDQRAKHALDTVLLARPEPNVIGWQEVRGYLQEAARAVIGTGTNPAAQAVELKRKADRALAGSRR